MDRFKMNFSNSRNNLPEANHLEKLLLLKAAQNPQARLHSNLPLNSHMINRVHNAKPGCSACGKKVM